MLRTYQETHTAESEIVLEILEDKHIAGATRCIADTFAQGEPMSGALGITPEEFEHFARLFITKSAKEGLSVVAVNGVKEVIGATICEDYVSEPPEGIASISEKFGPIVQLLELLSNCYTNLYKVEPRSHFHIFMCGVYQSYAHLRLGQKLNHFAEDVARERGYRTLICEATGRVSQFVAQHQLKFEYVEEVSYHNFLYEGEAVFSDIDSVASCKVYHKAL
ncbi:MAG: hypothetical protein AAF632_12400 [Bacteroidota bacterium]